MILVADLMACKVNFMSAVVVAVACRPVTLRLCSGFLVFLYGCCR